MLGSARLGFFTSGIFPTFGFASGISLFQFTSEVSRYASSSANKVHSKVATVLDDKKGPFVNHPTGNIIDFSNFASNSSVSNVVTIFNPVANTSTTHDLTSTGNISFFSNGNLGAVCLGFNGNIYITSQAWGSATGVNYSSQASDPGDERDPVGGDRQGFAILDVEALDRTKTDLSSALDNYTCFTSSARGLVTDGSGNYRLNANIVPSITVSQGATARYNRRWQIIPEYTQSDFHGNVWSVSAYEMYDNTIL